MWRSNTVSLTNGCICCELRDDLVESLEGASDPQRRDRLRNRRSQWGGRTLRIALTFLDRRYERLLRLDSITCLVDAEGIFAQGDNDQLNMLKLRQIGFADLVVLNKTDLVSPAHVEVVRDWIGLHMKRVRIVEATHGEVPLEILLGAGRFDATELRDRASEESLPELPAGAGFDRWSYRSNEPLSLDALREMVKRRLPKSVYRCKGIIYTSDAPARRHALQVVGRRTQIVEIGGWAERTRLNEIVAIGHEMDGHELSELFDACRA